MHCVLVYDQGQGTLLHLPIPHSGGSLRTGTNAVLPSYTVWVQTFRQTQGEPCSI
jgi:hypothetical protein